MNTLSIEEIKREIQEQGFQHAGLFNQNNESIISYNGKGTPLKTKIAEIEKRLKSRSLPDGIYVIQAKNSLGTREKPATFYITKGNISNQKDQGTVIVQVPSTLSDGERSVISYERALELQTEVASLKLQIQALEKENEDLKEQLDEYEDEGLSDPAPTMLDSFKDLLPSIAPLVDKYFDQRDKQLMLMSRKLDIIENKTAGSSSQRQEPKKIDKARAFILWWDEQGKSYEESQMGPQIADAYNTAKSIADFAMKLQEISPEIYEQYNNFNHE